MKHKAACTLIALLLILSCSLIFDFSLTNARAATFSDVHSGDWYYEYVERAYGLGLMNGTGGTSFSPDGTLTRAMFVTVLWRLHGVDADTYRPSSVFDVFLTMRL